MQITDNALDLTDIDRSDDIERRIESEPESTIFTWYINFEFSKPGPYLIILLWLSTIAIGIFYGFDLLNLTVMDLSAPPGTDGAVADSKMKAEFSTRETSQQLLLYFNCQSCDSNTGIYAISAANNESMPIMQTMSNNLQKWLVLQRIFISYSDYYTTSAMYNGTNANLSTLANLLFVSQSNKSAIAIITFDSTQTEKVTNAFMDNTEHKCDDLSNDKIQISVTGMTAMSRAMTEQSKTDVGVNCLLLVPLALCVLAVIIRSWRLMLIPIACFTISICASFSLLRPFAEHVLNISPFAPAIMMAVTIAMSIDYSLFLLSRFVEEIERKGCNGHKKETRIAITREAVRQSVRWSGKVIALSGCILSLTFFGLVFYPMVLLQSVGLGSGLAIICTIVVNLTCTPALLLIFPDFFNKFGWAGCPCQRIERCNKNQREAVVHVQPLSINDDMATVNRDENERRISNPFVELQTEVEVTEQNKSVCEKCWYKCASKITVCPWSILIVIIVYAGIAPFGYHFLSFKEQLDDTLIFPRDSPYVHTYAKISDDFSAGFMAPWNILIFAKNEHSKVYANPYETGANMTYLTETGLIINETIHKCYENGYYLTMEGVGYIGGATEKNINISSMAINISAGVNGYALNAQTQSLLYGQSSLTNYRQVYQFMINGKISQKRSSSYYSMTTEFDPYYENAIEFVDDFRHYLYDACAKYGYARKCYLTGGSVGEVDMVGEIYANVAWILSIIVATVFCLMGCAFKSVFVPFRLFATIAVPMSFVFGLSVMVYQNGLLSWLDSPAVGNTDGLFWLIPIMTVSILIGLALDYDIFLFARIYEYRIMGRVSTEEAIVRGVYKTGSIITAAGVIMAISFGGLIFSQITALCQTGFILVVGVLVDTFVIRTALVPAILSIAKEANWWPGLRQSQSQKNMQKEHAGSIVEMDTSSHITSQQEIQQMYHDDVNQTM